MPVTDKILVIGASGQLGSELTHALCQRHGENQVIAADIKPNPTAALPAQFETLDVLDSQRLSQLIDKHRITQIYHLAAMLSAAGEKNPEFAWKLNVNGLLNVLNIAVEKKLNKVFYPSTIAVFGPNTPKQHTPQHTVMDPVTVYGISKLAGERWCEYYFRKAGLDVRGLRYPGLISYKTPPGGGTTDYAIEIFHKALENQHYSCFLSENTCLPMMYMPDAVRATLSLMETEGQHISIRSAYNLSALSFTPAEIAAAIRKVMPDFEISYEPDFRQAIADSWSASIDDSTARRDWGWQPEFSLEKMTEDMLTNLTTMIQK